MAYFNYAKWQTLIASRDNMWVKAHEGGVLFGICGMHTSVKIKVHFTLTK
jgi:hypothetical protein